MRPKSLVLLLLALGCGLVASIGISQVMDRRGDGGAPGDTQAIFVTLQDISYNEPLTLQNLKLEEWPSGKVPPGALTKVEDIQDRRAGTKLYAGEPVLQGKLLGADEGGASKEIPKGYRIVAVPADAVSNAGSLIQPGDRVDVLCYVNANAGRGVVESGTHTILQDVRVFAVDSQYKEPEDKGGQPILAKTVTLLVTPAQAAKVSLAADIGKIRFAVRSPDDQGDSDGASVSLPDIFASSDKSERDKEHADSRKTGTPLDKLLPGLNPPAVAATTPTVPSQRFTMELLTGSDLTTVDFTRADDAARWESNSVDPNQIVPSPSAAPPAAPADDPPPDPSAETPAVPPVAPPTKENPT